MVLQAQLARATLGKFAVQLGTGYMPALVRNALVLQLDVEIARLVKRGELLRPLLGLGKLLHHRCSDGIMPAIHATGSNDALGVLLEHLERSARTIVEIVYMRFADQLQQVVIALVLFLARRIM